jgi:hypothetical protein
MTARMQCEQPAGSGSTVLAADAAGRFTEPAWSGSGA